MSFNSLRVYWKSALCCKTHRAWSIPSEIRIFPVKRIVRHILAPHLDLHAVIFLELIEQIPERSVAEGNQPLAPQEPFVFGYPPRSAVR